MRDLKLQKKYPYLFAVRCRNNLPWRKDLSKAHEQPLGDGFVMRLRLESFTDRPQKPISEMGKIVAMLNCGRR